ncbi:Hypothetical predicted protein [Octopus vulgaris]|uniref:Uncharacterized protein n=1 Tax=Octopus vulgaris TaxID=6645 RepID=A0AA36B341_OCTVU|nr:Hypothetical predicted protein [Octopus vulgaris]
MSSSGEMVHLEMPTNQYGTSPKCSTFTGVWQEPDMSQCYNTEGITQQLKNITSEDINEENVEEVSTILSNISKKSVYFKAEDIDLAVDIQEKMLPLISNVLLDIIEAIPEEIPLKGQQLTVLHPNLGIGAIKVEKDTFNGAVYGISFGNKENEAKTMVTQNSSTKANTMINSNIIAANIPNIKVTNLDEPVNISFNLIDQNVYPKPVVNIHPLSMTSYIGCGISFVCLILTIIIHVCSKSSSCHCHNYSGN